MPAATTSTTAPTPIHGAPQIKMEQVTPATASQYLGTSAGNRNIRKRVVQRYARDMLLGRWVVNGEAIKFDRAGHLVDGHHRLHAIVEAKATLPMLVVRGIQEGAMLTLDTGAARTFMDAQAVRGNHVSSTLGPILRWWYRYTVTHMAGNSAPTHQELQEILDVHPHCVESARMMARLKVVRSRCTPGVQGFVHAYASYKFDRDLADEFMQELNDGAGLNKTSPILLLRQRLVDTPSRVRLDGLLVLALSIKAWNAWLTHGSMQTLRWVTEGDHPEAFPVFKGDEEQFAKVRMLKAEQLMELRVRQAKDMSAKRKRIGGKYITSGGT